MGFLLKSVFWLGVVYAAMPFDEPSKREAEQRAAAAICASVGPLLFKSTEAQARTLASAGCAAIVAERAAWMSSRASSPAAVGGKAKPPRANEGVAVDHRVRL